MLLHVCLEGWETGHSIGLSFVLLYGYHVPPPTIPIRQEGHLPLCVFPPKPITPSLTMRKPQINPFLRDDTGTDPHT